MKDEKGISLIALLVVIILVCFGILGFKYISNNKAENTNTSKDTYTTTNPTTNTKTENNTTNNSSVGLGKEFKQAMDSYERFMDEYVAFMLKFKSDRTNAQMIKDYSTYMTKYAEAMSDFEKWDGKDLNKEEAKYYVEVQTRVTQKLMNASIDMSY